MSYTTLWLKILYSAATASFGDLFLYFNYAHLSFRRYRAACAVYADQRIQHASGAPQKNREMDDAALAVCQSDGCHCILNDLTVLLKKAVLCAAFSID